MTAWLREIRYAARTLNANRSFTVAAVLATSIGIAATTAVFSVVNAVLLRPVPFTNGRTVVAVGTVSRTTPERLQGASLAEVRDWREQSRSLAAIAAWRDWGMLRYDGDARDGAFAIITTPELFQVFDVPPALGRVFHRDDDRPGWNEIVLLADNYWRTRFSADPAVIGRTIVLEREKVATYTIVGVLPAGFNEIGPFDGVDLVALSSIDPDARDDRRARNRQVLARLHDDASIRSARREMDAIASRLAAAYPDTNADREARVVPLADYLTGPAAGTLRTFFVAVASVLLIACANVAGLVLARALARRREFSIRQALGGDRASIVRSLVAETALISLAGGTVGVGLAAWLVDVVLRSAPPVLRAYPPEFDLRVLAFAVAACFVAALLLSLPAALLATRVPLRRALQQEATIGHPAVRARLLFVGAQVALAMILAVGAVLASETLIHQLNAPIGFNAAGLSSVQIFPPKARYPDGGDVVGLYQRAIEAARSVPGVAGVSAVSAPPLSGEGAEPEEFTIGGMVSSPSQPITANTFNVAAGYFSALGAPLVRGRDFETTDTVAAPHVAIVNEAFVRRYLGEHDPLDTHLRVAGSGELLRIVGVAGDLLQVAGPRAAPEAEIYWPYAQRPRWATFLVVRSDGSAATMNAIHERLLALDPNIQVGAQRIMSERIDRAARGPRFVAFLLATCAIAAVVLSAIGISGIVFYIFSQRTREIAVRTSLGATPGHILRLVGTSALTAVVAGSVAGAGGALATARVMAAALRELEPLEPLTLGTAWLLIASVGWAACFLAARRALRIDPVQALRLE
jgi:putative ABC transport system permease protein